MSNFFSNLPKITIPKKKRKGRGLGSGRGAKSGRGITRHQKARESIPIHFEGGQGRIVKRFPLLRGKGKNKSINQKPLIINLDDLNIFKEEAVVDKESLITLKIIDKKQGKLPLKILANGELKKKLIIKLPVSKKAKTIIEKLGGRVEIKK